MFISNLRTYTLFSRATTPSVIRKTCGTNDVQSIFETAWEISAMVCAQHYSQREWVVGTVFEGDGGCKLFEVSLPLVFHGTSQLMQIIHDQFTRESVSVVVTRHCLQWQSDSFKQAIVLSSRAVGGNIVTACKCGVLPPVKKQRRAKAKASKKQSSTSTPASLPPLSGLDSDFDSDDSLLSALAEALDNYQFSDDDEDFKFEESAEHTKQLDELTRLSNAVATASKYQKDLGETSPPSQLEEQAGPARPVHAVQRENLKEVQQLEDMFDAVAVSDAIKTLKASKPKPKSALSEPGSSEKTADSTSSSSRIVSEAALSECLRDVNVKYGGLIDPEEEANEGLLSLANFPDDVGQRQAGNQTSSTSDGPDGDLFDSWAHELFNTALAFHEYRGEFFPSLDTFHDRKFDKAISLVQFQEDIQTHGQAIAALDVDAVGDGLSESNLENLEHAHTTSASLLQYISWDFPEPPRMIGRRLRTEADRFVWKPPSRNLIDDSLGALFEKRAARAVIVPYLSFWFCKVLVLV